MSDRDFLHSESPSLLSGRSAGGLEGGEEKNLQAFELKFHVPESVALDMEAWASSKGFAVDPHGDPSRNGVYDTTTLYLDTSDLDVYHRRPGYARRKYRIRRYGSGTDVHFECKTKRGDLVSKERTVVGEVELGLLAQASAPETWAGHRFHAEVSERRLLPACVVAYTRLAFIGSCDEGPLRLTIDRDAKAVLRSGWSMDLLREGEGTPVLTGHAIVELKYITSVPLPFKELLVRLSMNPGGVSKYRMSRQLLGTVGHPGESSCQNG